MPTYFTLLWWDLYQLTMSGKQTVYHTPQNPTSSSNTPETIALLDSEIELLKAELATLKSEEKKTRSSLLVLLAIPRIADLRSDIQRLGNERDEMQARAKVKEPETEAGAMAVAISPEERTRLENEWKAWFRQASIRRRICRDMWERCSEVLPGGMSAMELWVWFPLLFPFSFSVSFLHFFLFFFSV